jgi:catechol 2,3-dioxygenase-like lactoylglutathione lyase family enzyme
MLMQPMIAVHDVAASSRWYQQLLDCASGHGGDEYEQLVQDGRVLLQLHHWDAHEHPHLGDPAQPRGNGMLLWFETDAFDAAVQRASTLGAVVLQPPAVNPLAQHREIWLRDPDGYVVVLASPYGDTGAPA